MNKTHATPTVKRNRRLRALVAATAVVGVTGGVLAGSTSSASAAPVSMTLVKNQIGFYPTWFWGATALCVKPLTNDAGRVRITVLTPGLPGEYVDTPRGQEKCIYRYWWGAQLLVNNIGANTVQVKTY
jgi:hypothetical protein